MPTTAKAGEHMRNSAYCLKCRVTVDNIKGKVVESSKGMLMFKGVCPTCGTNVNKILGKHK